MANLFTGSRCGTGTYIPDPDTVPVPGQGSGNQPGNELVECRTPVPNINLDPDTDPVPGHRVEKQTNNKLSGISETGYKCEFGSGSER